MKQRVPYESPACHRGHPLTHCNELIWRRPSQQLMFDCRNPPKSRHYCRLANATKPTGENFHLDWTEGRIEHYRRKFGDDFCLIFYRNIPPLDFYAIPFEAIKDAIPHSHLDGRRRWHGYIQDHKLKVTRRPYKVAVVDISDYYNTVPKQ